MKIMSNVENMCRYLDTSVFGSTDATVWKDICAVLEPLAAPVCVDDFLILTQHFQDRILNVAFSNPRVFRIFEPIIAPLWQDPRHFKHLMRAVSSVTRDRDPYDTLWITPFVAQASVFDTPEMVAALKLYPNAFSRVFMVRPQHDISCATVDLWLEHGLCSHEQLIEWALLHQQEHKITHLSIPQATWTEFLIKNEGTYFIESVLKISNPDARAENAWTVVANHLPGYDDYENGFGDWTRDFCTQMLSYIDWDAQKMHVVLERTVGQYHTNLEMGKEIENLYACLPDRARPLLHPYLLLFDFKRSAQLKELTQHLEAEQQNNIIHASLGESAPPKTVRKM